ncbi:hypothetical protein Cgig2_011736 [Carnegiea gigantea]|uniref:Uncharacterized protein n=1 Tax=Carnegiea gigantea TaxID=171969 RepID=A0A9Q1KL21_9CARY|nr:hypothetical protein Cgig2_011736 [Carnegiea gigantea]
MRFPRSLKTDEMVRYVVENFEWYHRGVSFPPLPLPSDYEDLCPDFDLAVAKEATRDFKLPEMPEVVFVMMLLNDAVKLGVLCGWIIGMIKLALKELRWSTFQAWVWRNRSRHLEARIKRRTVTKTRRRGVSRSQDSHLWGSVSRSVVEIASLRVPLLEPHLGKRERTSFVERFSVLSHTMVFLNFLTIEQAANYVRETFKWHLRGFSRPPLPLPELLQPRHCRGVRLRLPYS